MGAAIKKTPDANGIYAYVESINSPDYPLADWDHSPEIDHLAGVSRNYWKWVSENNIVEMSQAEKDAVDEAAAVNNAATTIAGTLAFEKNNLCKNKWLGFGIGKPSNRTPFVIPATVQVTALTFINSNNGVETDVEVYKNGTLVHTWELRDTRWAWVTQGLHSLIFVPGDYVGIFLRDRGTDPRNCIVTMHYTTQQTLVGEGSQPTL